MRIVTLLPSATEIVAELGFADSIVGTSHECDYPVGMSDLPSLTEPRIPQSDSSLVIDLAVRDALKHALTVYTLDVERLQALNPDVIVTQDLCDVCAVSFSDVECAVQDLGLDAKIIRLHPTKLGDIFRDIQHVADVLGAPEAGVAALARLQARMDDVRDAVHAREDTPRVLSIEWIDPIMPGGTWMPELIEVAGGRALITSPGDHAPTLTDEQLRELPEPPDVILIKPCGFELERSEKELDVLRARFDGLDWPALRDGRVFLADGNAFFNRSGPRIVDSTEIMAACAHPELAARWAEQHRTSFYRLEL